MRLYGDRLCSSINTHLHRYLAEFDFRYSYRVRLGYSDDMRAEQALKGISHKRLMYRTTRQAEIH
jgi:hypothetical protein